jgi:hypothetical protein
MDALIPLFLCLTALIALDMAALAFGKDSRDGFTDDRRPPGIT